jgi:DNA gyrase subunit A
MARRTKRPTTALPLRTEEIITEIALEEELSSSYMEYALSVIISRAIPDARDGLKPVQRRILYAMLEAGLRSDKPYRKSIAAVGDTMKKYHPHGDSAIYETLVRMAQEWVMNAPLVDGHGNFGSLDDGPAAARYTEARLSKFAEALLANVEESTVLFAPNFDASTVEPRVLPAGIPALLVNGASGIAVGMATNIPPHNLSEVTAACQLLLENPKATLDDVLKLLPAPDFPTGGSVIASKAQLREMYATGRGQVKMRATVEISDVTPRRRGITVTALPYNTGPEKVIARVKELVAQKKLDGIADVKDLSDRKNGLRLVFEVKSGFNPEAVLAELYRLTPLEESFAMNAVALVDNRPVVADLLTLLRTYVNHRIEVIRRRCEHRLQKAEARLHTLTALIAALADIDEVVRIIRASKDAETARTKLMKRLGIDAEQANHILDMPLRRLTSLEATKLNDELKELQKAAKGFSQVIKSEKKQREMVSSELTEITAVHGRPRDAKITDPAKLPVIDVTAVAAGSGTTATPSKTAAPSLKIASTPVIIGLTMDQRLVCNPDVACLAKYATESTATVLAVSETGRVWHIDVAEVGSASVEASAFTHTAEKIIALLPLGAHFVVGSKSGVVKRVADDTPTLAQLKRTNSAGLPVISLKEGDKLVGVAECSDTSELVFITTGAQLLRTSADTVRPQGKSGGGVAGVKLRKDDHVCGFFAVSDTTTASVVVVSDAGNAKVSPLNEYPSQGRATGGVRCMTFKKQDTAVLLTRVGSNPVKAYNKAGKLVKFEPVTAKRDASGTPLETAPVALTD